LNHNTSSIKESITLLSVTNVTYNFHNVVMINLKKDITLTYFPKK